MGSKGGIPTAGVAVKTRWLLFFIYISSRKRRYLKMKVLLQISSSLVAFTATRFKRNHLKGILHCITKVKQSTLALVSMPRVKSIARTMLKWFLLRQFRNLAGIACDLLPSLIVALGTLRTSAVSSCVEHCSYAFQTSTKPSISKSTLKRLYQPA